MEDNLLTRHLFSRLRCPCIYNHTSTATHDSAVSPHGTDDRVECPAGGIPVDIIGNGTIRASHLGSILQTYGIDWHYTMEKYFETAYHVSDPPSGSYRLPLVDVFESSEVQSNLCSSSGFPS